MWRTHCAMGISGKPLEAPQTRNETYDLVVVGGGISGLAAAYFYRKNAGKSSRVLVLDNNDDFGGPRPAQRVPRGRTAAVE